MRQLLLKHHRQHPTMRPADFVKLLYQSRFGPGHFISDPQKALARLKAEYQSCPRGTGPLFHPLGGSFCRLDLAVLEENELSLETLNRLFVYSAGLPADSKEAFEDDLALLDGMVRLGEIDLDREEWDRYLQEYKAAGYPAVSHSEDYRQAYQPAYRVLHRSCRDYWPVLSAVDRLLRKKGGGVVAIDGGSGTGKSHLAAMLEAVFPAAAVHMDDFFLQPDQRTAQRLAEPGGNLDYERFQREILPGLGEKAPFSYQIFDCSLMALSGWQEVADKPIRILEGVYSQHPKWSDRVDVKVFLTAAKEIRLGRIEKRNGTFLLKKFQQQWIPMEDTYFEAFNIQAASDTVVDTSEFF